MRDHDFWQGPHLQIQFQTNGTRLLSLVDFCQRMGFALENVYKCSDAVELLALVSTVNTEQWLFCFATDSKSSIEKLANESNAHIQSGNVGVAYFVDDAVKLTTPKVVIGPQGIRRETSSVFLPGDVGGALSVLESFINVMNMFMEPTNTVNPPVLLVYQCKATSPK